MTKGQRRFHALSMCGAIGLFGWQLVFADAVVLRCKADMVSEQFSTSQWPSSKSQELSLTVTIESTALANGHHQRVVRAVDTQLLFSIMVDSDAGADHAFSFDRSDTNQWFIGLTEEHSKQSRTQFVKIQRGSGYFVYGDNTTNAAGNTLSTIHIQGNCLD